MPKRATMKARVQPQRVRKRAKLLSINRVPGDAGVYTAAKVEDRPGFADKFFDETACPSTGLFDSSDAKSSDSEWVEETKGSARRQRKITEKYAQYKKDKN